VRGVGALGSTGAGWTSELFTVVTKWSVKIEC
jgi:hypothetical protein